MNYSTTSLLAPFCCGKVALRVGLIVSAIFVVVAALAVAFAFPVGSLAFYISCGAGGASLLAFCTLALSYCCRSRRESDEEKKAFEDFQVKYGALFAELIAKYFTHQDDRTGAAVLSPSSLGKCTRQLAYKYHGFEGEPFSYETIMTFMTGDILELVAYMLADAVDSPISDIQKQVTIGETSGSIDGVVGDIVVDIKSMSDAAFNINQQNGAMDDGFGYLTQILRCHIVCIAIS